MAVDTVPIQIEELSTRPAGVHVPPGSPIMWDIPVSNLYRCFGKSIGYLLVLQTQQRSIPNGKKHCDIASAMTPAKGIQNCAWHMCHLVDVEGVREALLWMETTVPIIVAIIINGVRLSRPLILDIDIQRCSYIYLCRYIHFSTDHLERFPLLMYLSIPSSPCLIPANSQTYYHVFNQSSFLCPGSLLRAGAIRLKSALILTWIRMM